MDLQRKLDAAEKVELYRRIRVGFIMEVLILFYNDSVFRAVPPPRRIWIVHMFPEAFHVQPEVTSFIFTPQTACSGAATRSGRGMGEGRRRRQSLSPEAGDLIKRVENDYRSDSAPFKNPKSIYNRLAANVYKYQYLHKVIQK